MSANQVTNESSPQANPRGPTHNIFEDPAIAAAAKNDPFVRWISKHWRSVVAALITFAALMIGYNRFTTVSREKQASATAALYAIQEVYDQLSTKEESLAGLRLEISSKNDAAAKGDLQKQIETSTREVDQLRDKVTLMVDSLDTSGQFGMIGNLYRGLLAAGRKDFDKTRALLNGHSWEQVGKPESSERFMAELLSLALSRALLESPTDREFARAQLLALAQRGSFVAVQGGNALFVAAENEAERAAAQEVLSQLRARFPGQQKFLGNSAAN